MDLFSVVPALSTGFTALGFLLLILVLGVHYRGEWRRRHEAGFRNATAPVVDRYLAGSAGLEEAVAALKKDLPAALSLLLDRAVVLGHEKTPRLRALWGNLPYKEPMLAGLKENDRDIRSLNARSLGYLGDESTIPGLMDALDDEAPAVRLAAAHSLARLGYAGAVKPILLNPDFAGNMSGDRVVEVLVQFGDCAIDPLLAVLTGPQIPERTLAIAVQACGMLHAKQAVPMLVEALQHKTPEIRRKALDALASIGDPSAITPISRLAEDPDHGVRSSVMSSLGILHATGHIPLVVKALADPTWEIRLSAGRALYQMGSEGRKALGDAAIQQTDSHARRISRQVLQTHGHDLPTGTVPL